LIYYYICLLVPASSNPAYNIANPANSPPAINPTTPGKFIAAAPVLCVATGADVVADDVREAEVARDECVAFDDCCAEVDDMDEKADEVWFSRDAELENEICADREAEPDGYATLETGPYETKDGV
jgi:hypothetical protein